MKNHRLDKDRIPKLLELAKIGGYPLTEEVAKEFCRGEDPIRPCTMVYGIEREDGALAAMLTATYSLVFPHVDGYRMVHISGAYTREDMRHRGFVSVLLSAIEEDAKTYFKAHYLCCDSTAPELYEKAGFLPSSETRMWKVLTTPSPVL